MIMLRQNATDSSMIQKHRPGLSRERNTAGLAQPHKFARPSRVKTEGASTVYSHPDITCVAEFIRNKLYFATIATGRREPRSTPDIHLFNVDNELVYTNFYNDFGPLNLACLYKYCCKLNKKLRNPGNKHKQIVHYTSQNEEKRANAAYLMGSYAILYLKKNPRDAHATLTDECSSKPLKPFQDASIDVSMYNIRLQDCLNAIHKAAAFGFFNFEDFDLAEYEKYELMKNGDLNWIVPQKFLAFTGPSTEIGTAYHPPELYIDYFAKNGVAAVVRLNKKTYEASRFTRAGIAHYDMFMPDGSSPPRHILNKFLQLAESTNNRPIAVHCKAGLGRTGSLIAAYLVKHYAMTAREAIAWLRICRPGSVIGHQQTWLESMENELWRAGQQYRLKHHGDGNMILHHKRGIYSIARKLQRKLNLIVEKDAPGSKKHEKNAGNGSISTVGNEIKGNPSAPRAANKIAKPGITSIFGKLCLARGPRTTRVDVQLPVGNRKLDVDASKCKAKVNEASRDNRTQGDRLNEIKAGRNKFY